MDRSDEWFELIENIYFDCYDNLDTSDEKKDSFKRQNYCLRCWEDYLFFVNCIEV